MQPQDIEAELSYVYLHAVASHAGVACQLATRSHDNLGIDATLSTARDFGKGAVLTEVSLHFQLKATIKAPVCRDGRLSYFLTDLEQYDRLRAPSVLPPRLLAVLFLPSDQTNWLELSPEQMILRRAAYWVSLVGAPASTNRSGRPCIYPNTSCSRRQGCWACSPTSLAVGSSAMPPDPRYRSMAAKLRPLAVRLYAESRRWVPIKLPNERFWLFRHPEQTLRQLQIPMDAEDVGFVDAMLDVVHRLAELEQRPVEAVLVDLQWPDADVLRVRVASRDTEAGQLSLTADVTLREGARRALLASACSVINPARFHPRLSRSEADALLAACRAGQTEVGSYVVKIICPLHAVDAPDEDAPPFTRQVTTYLMRATADLVTSIEQDNVDAYLADKGEGPLLSWNLCDALLRMQPEHQAGQLELSTAWAADRRVAPPSASQAPSRVSIKAEYMPEIEQVAKILRPSTSGQREEQLVGTVEQLAGVVGADGRRSGEVHLALLLPDGEQLRVRVSLSPEQYEVAMRAHERGDAYVRVRGVLHRGQRSGRVDPLREISLLDDLAPA